MTKYPEIEELNRAVFKGVFGVLKKMDAYLQFYMFTGVTKFSKVSIFSDLNQLTDISLSEKYSHICGISQDELQSTFKPYINSIAKRFQLNLEQCLDELKQMYDGYHFCGDGDGLYNPYSLLHAFDENKFGAYWFESGTPTFLIDKLKTSKVDVRLFLDDAVEAGDVEGIKNWFKMLFLLFQNITLLQNQLQKI